jgi:hypothetical protein
MKIGDHGFKPNIKTVLEKRAYVTTSIASYIFILNSVLVHARE